MKKINYLDALRGLAVLGVIMVHSNHYGLPVDGFFKSLIEKGNMGVQLFFIASSFTLFLSRDSRIEDNPIKKFFIRRFFRIAPLFYLGMAYYLWQNGLGPRYFLGDIKSISFENILSTFTFTNGFNPYFINSIVPGGWSIAVEFVFYATLPLFVYKIVKNLNSAVLFLIASILFSFILNLILSKNQLISEDYLWQEFLYIYFPSQLPVFAIGIVLYYIIIKKESFFEINSFSFILISLMLILQLSTPLTFFPQHIVFSFAFSLIILALSIKSNKILVNRFTIFLGKLSFSLYLCHFAVLYWLQRFNLVDFTERSLINYSIKFSITLLLSTACAYIIYNFIEKPFIKLGNRLINCL